MSLPRKRSSVELCSSSPKKPSLFIRRGRFDQPVDFSILVSHAHLAAKPVHYAHELCFRPDVTLTLFHRDFLLELCANRRGRGERRIKCCAPCVHLCLSFVISSTCEERCDEA